MDTQLKLEEQFFFHLVFIFSSQEKFELLVVVVSMLLITKMLNNCVKFTADSIHRPDSRRFLDVALS